MHHSDLVFLDISKPYTVTCKITAKYVQKNAKGYSEIYKISVQYNNIWIYAKDAEKNI